MLNTQLLDVYTDYLLTSFSAVTATGLSKAVNHAYSHDQITRLLSKEEYSQKQYWHTIKPLVRQIEQEDGIVIVDDTIEEKPYTDENDIVCWHYDHTTGQNVKGINIINFLYHTELPTAQEVCLPLAYEVVSKPETYLDPKTQKTKRKSTVSKNTLVRERLKILRFQNQIRFKYVVFDSWFSSKDNMVLITTELGKQFVCAIKANRTVALSLADKLAGQFVQVSTLDLKPNELRLVYLKGIEDPVLLAKHVFTNKDGSIGVLYLVTSDTALTYEQLTTLYHKRWTVEEFHTSLKQNVALEKSPTKTVTTQRNHIFAAMVAFIKLETLKLHASRNHFALKGHLYIKAIQACFKELKTLQQQYAFSPIQFTVSA
jgi:hypothetical protein